MAPEHGDIFLLCSDGLTGEVTDEQITQILIEADGDLEGAVERLIQTACENGGKDNVTAVLVQVVLD
jgi:protein phosphatase